MDIFDHASVRLERIANKLDVMASRIEAKITDAKADLMLVIGTMALVQMTIFLFLVLVLIG